MVWRSLVLRARIRRHQSSARLARPELAVAGVAQARQDVALVVQLAVEGRAVDVDVWVSLRDGADALRRGDQVDELDPDGAPALEDLDGGGRRAAGCKHRIEDEAEIDGRRVRQLVVVLDGP